MARVMFVGDVSLGEYYLSFGHGPRTLANQQSIFVQVQPILEQADLVVGNLEAPLCSNDYDESEPEDIVLKADPVHAAQLREAGFGIMQVANNHTMQHGESGFDESLRILEQHNIDAVGLHQHGPVEFECEGVRLGFMAASDVPDNTFLDQKRYQRLDERFVERVMSEARNFDHLIVMLHWGLESSTRPLPYQRELVDRLRAAGVSAIIGSHPHLFYEIENTEGMVTAYSLGNFVFDLCWDERLLQSGILDIHFYPDSVQARFWPVTITENGCVPVPSGAPESITKKLIPYDLGDEISGQQLQKMIYMVKNLHRGMLRPKLKFLGRKLLGPLAKPRSKASRDACQ